MVFITSTWHRLYPLPIPGQNLSYLSQQFTMGNSGRAADSLPMSILTYQTAIPPDHSMHSGAT